MRRLLLALALLLASCLAAPAGAGTEEYMNAYCAAIDEKRDGIRCDVTYIDGIGQTLRIRITAPDPAPQAQRNRTMLAIGAVFQTFHGRGGRHTIMRRHDPKGVLLERHCTRPVGRPTEHCADWYPVAAPGK
jgi:hypothetical protein